MILGKETPALITGGASGLGEATARTLAAHGVPVGILDLNRERGEALARELGGVFQTTDVSNPDHLANAIAAAAKALGGVRLAVSCAGICKGMKTLGRDKASGALTAHTHAMFERHIAINLVGTFNFAAQSALLMAKQHAMTADGERGVIICTASVAAEDGQIGQAAYAASKAGVTGMILPMARDLARDGIRVMAIMPGIFHTPMFDDLDERTTAALGSVVPFPSRLGQPSEYADLVISIAQNSMLNGTAIRLDGALRMPPK